MKEAGGGGERADSEGEGDGGAGSEACCCCRSILRDIPGRGTGTVRGGGARARGCAVRGSGAVRGGSVVVVVAGSGVVALLFVVVAIGFTAGVTTTGPPCGGTASPRRED